MSIRTDVTHDPAAAREAIDELRRAADHLEGLTDARSSLAAQATGQWQGARRAEFDEAVTRLVQDSGELVTELRRAATRIAEEDEAAAVEQRRRERLRELLPAGQPVAP